MSSEKYGANLDASIAEIWRTAHECYKVGNLESAYGLYRELRRDFSVELFYEIEPPEHVRFIHPIGCVLGRATYGKYNVFYQCSGVGSDLDGNRPTLGDGVVLFPGARVLGRAKVGNNVFIQANVVVDGGDVPDNAVVYAKTPNWSLGGDIRAYHYRPTKRTVINTFFGERPDA